MLHRYQGPMSQWRRSQCWCWSGSRNLDYLDDLKHDQYKWLTPMLSTTTSNKDGRAFLQATNFITSYKHVLSGEPRSIKFHWLLTLSALLYEWLDGANFYGEARRLFCYCSWLALVSLRLVFVSIVIVVNYSIEPRFTVGSYAVGFRAVFLAIFTFLSAIK